ncbi:glycosyltransferase family 87 protein [Nocardia sp. NPDC055321]
MITMRTGRGSLPRTPKSVEHRYIPRVPIALGIALSIAIVALVSGLHGFLDLQVYQVATRAWLHHSELYGPILPVAGHTNLPFTYPPSAAVLMIPLALMPLWLAEFAVTASSLGSLGVTIWLVLSRIRPDLDARAKATVSTVAVVALLAVEPVRTTLWFGQINLILMAAVALDCLSVKPRWPRGVLIGIAAVTKLTPAAFVLYFLIRGDFKAAGRAALTAAAVVGAGFVLFPRESRAYWFHAVKDTNRIGSPHYVGNQSIKGTIFRLGLPHTMSTVLWLGLAVVVTCLGAALIHHLFGLERLAAGASVTVYSVVALFVNAAVLLLISPVSWTHHWVWVGPALVAAAAWASTKSGRASFGMIAAFAALFLIGPGLVPNGNDRELRWAWWQHIPGDGYFIAGTALLGAGLYLLLARRAAAVAAPVTSPG